MLTKKELVETDHLAGNGILLPDEPGQEVKVSYDIRCYLEMIHVSVGGSTLEGTRSIEGMVGISGDQYWARRVLGKRFTLIFEDGKRRLHLVIKDVDGRIADIDGRGIYLEEERQ